MESRKSFMLKNYEFTTINGIPCNLGFGAYGSVQLGKSLVTKQTVAIKKIGRKIALGEVEAHMQLNHPNIIKMLDYHFDEKLECTYIILEYAENGTLFDYIRQNDLKDKRMIRGIFQSVCEAVDYMHTNNIMHRDIKPENVLLDRKNVVKVCDFGFAAKCEPRMTLCGTVQYMAPEMILRKPYTHKIDIWGLGILLFQMIEGRAPFEGKTQEEVLEKMKKPLYFSKNFSIQEIQLIHKILRVDPNERPQIKDILKSSWLWSSKRMSQQIGKRSTADQEVQMTKQKKIKIVEVIDLRTGKAEGLERTEKREKKNSHNSYNIEITSIRDLNISEKLQLNTEETVPHKIEKVERSIVSIGMLPVPKQKISLRRATRKS